MNDLQTEHQLNVMTSPTGSDQYDHFLGPLELLQKVIKVFREKWQVYLTIFAPLMIIALLVALIVPAKQSGGTETVVDPRIFLVFPVVILEGIVSLIVTLGLIVAVARRSESLPAMEAVKLGTKRFWSYLGVAVLTSFVSGGASLLLFFPGLIVNLMVIFAPYIALIEGIGGMEALVRSRAYTRGRLLGIFGRLIFLILPAIPLYIVLALFGKFSGVFSPVLSIFFTIYVILMYENLRALNPNVDSKVGGKTRRYFTIFAWIGPIVVLGGIIAAIVLLAINPAKLLKTSRDTQRLVTVQQLKMGLELYQTKNGIYPSSLNLLDSSYTKNITDPKTGQPAQYSVSADGKSYQLCVTMEDLVKYPDGEKCVTESDSAAFDQSQFGQYKMSPSPSSDDN